MEKPIFEKSSAESWSSAAIAFGLMSMQLIDHMFLMGDSLDAE